MILNLTFSQGLLVFTATLTVLFLVILKFSKSSPHTCKKQSKSSSERLSILVIIGVFLIEVTIIALLLTHQFNLVILSYSILVIIASCLLFYTLRSLPSSGRIPSYALLCFIIYHVCILANSWGTFSFPPSGMIISERTPAMSKLDLEGRWYSNWTLLNPVYNPFPADVAITNAFSMSTSIPYTSSLNRWILCLFLIVAFDLILYSLTKQVTGSAVLGLLVILIVACTPPINIVAHLPKWFGNLLVLISALLFIRILDGSSNPSKILVANVSYGAAILFHPSAATGAFLPLGILLVYSLKIRRSGARTEFPEKRLLLVIFIVSIVITLARAVYTAGYLEVIVPSLRNFVEVMFGFESPAQELTPVYEQLVSPVNAYAWAIMPAMASALVGYGFLRRKFTGNILVYAFYLVGVGFIFLGLLSGITKGGSFQGAMYPALIFLAPAAAVVGGKALNSSKVIAAIFVFLMVSAVVVAMSDPMLSQWAYRKTGAGDVPPEVPNWHIEAQHLMVSIPDKELLAPYEMRAYSSYIEVVEEDARFRYVTRSADLLRVELRKIVEEKEVQPHVIYIWPQWWSLDIEGLHVTSHLASVPIDVLYDSGRYTVFEKALD